MAMLDATGEAPAMEGNGRPAAWTRWWLAGTAFDWGFVGLAAILVSAGYEYAWMTRNRSPLPKGSEIPFQAAWVVLALFLVVTGVLAWRRTRRASSLIRDGYAVSAVGCALFLVGVLINGWWTEALGPAIGVPAIFRLPNLLEIAGGVLIVVGPLLASTGRGELVAGPTALLSAVLLLATVTFFTQFDHPYIDRYASIEVRLPSPLSAFDAGNHREEILGALGLMMQAAAVTGVILWILKQTRLPVGSITLMLTVSAFFTATQLGHFSMVGVGLIVGVLGDVILALLRPRADRVLRLHVFAVLMGALSAGVYLVWISFDPGTWWQPDMTFGTVVACGIVGGLMSYFLFPGADAVRAASVLWPAMTQESSTEAPDVTVERVEHALKVLHSTRDLADSPLIAMRCIAAPSSGELRKTIQDAIEHLRSSAFQQDAQAGQILDLYYVHRIGGHYAVEMRVGLSRAAYFNRRSYGVRRLVDRLRELEESASPA
ncbi:MAG: hypothetical protein E6J28_03695 [Chloroflexi bacterium]|nr:MAG: hypothetical protein E6J28_03695 [Chloroflexota bacterium]